MPANPKLRDDVAEIVRLETEERIAAIPVPEDQREGFHRAAQDVARNEGVPWIRRLELALDKTYTGPHGNAQRQAFLVAMERVMEQNFRLLDQGVRDGKLSEDGRVGSMTMAMIRAIDRLAALPDERDLTDDEIDNFQACLIQIACNALCLLVELPFEGLAVVLAPFDTNNPQ